MSKVYSSNGEIYFKNNSGQTVWSTLTRPLNLLSDIYKLTLPISISFPDFQKGDAYAFDKSTSAIGTAQTSCASFGTIIPAEYGPSATGIYKLPDILLGTVPSAVNYIDISVNISRTKNPTAILNSPVPKLVAENANVFLPGGSCLVEASSLFTRLFEIIRIGNNIYLRRYQSVRDSGETAAWGSEFTGNGVSLREGWTYAGSPKGQFSNFIDGKGPTGNVNKNRSASAATRCSLINTANFSSIWAGTVIITPGRYNG